MKDGFCHRVKTSMTFVFRQRLSTRTLGERDPGSMDLSICISPIISYCEILLFCSCRKNKYLLHSDLMVKKSPSRSENHQLSATESQELSQLFVQTSGFIYSFDRLYLEINKKK